MYGVAEALFINPSQLLWGLTAKVSPKSQYPSLKVFSTSLVPYAPSKVSNFEQFIYTDFRFLFFFLPKRRNVAIRVFSRSILVGLDCL